MKTGKTNERLPIRKKDDEDSPRLDRHPETVGGRRAFRDDWVLYRLITELDGLMQRGRPREGEGEKEIPPNGGNKKSRSPSAHRTAALLKCPARTVERARRIRKYGTDEILEALEKRRITIYQADKAIADKAKGESNTPPAPPEARDDMIQLTPENLEGLKMLGGDYFVHVNTALDEYLETEIRRMSVSQETDSEPADPHPRVLQ
ncbi:MAG: hypothetical protein V1792_27720 [Pseudomonadota bacterium]